MAGGSQGLEIFGWQIRRKEPESLPSFVPPIKDDGAVTVEATPGGFFSQTYVDLEGSARTEAEMVTRYRDIATQSEVDNAITQICNEIVVTDDEQKLVELDMEDGEDLIPDPVKEAILASFDKLLKIIDFNTDGWDIARRWYIDGRLYFHAIIDPANPQGGILELREIDPRTIRKIREVVRQRDQRTGATITSTINEYYIYNEKGFSKQAVGTGAMGSSVTGIKISKDAIVHTTSGITNGNRSQVLSHLQKSIKHVNQLRAIEDAAVIYRLVRAPQRRVFYVDTGNLPKAQAEAHVRDMMTKHRNKLVYDATTGTVKDDRLQQTMLDDYWLARREGNKSTEISILESGGSLGEMAEVEYFQKQLFRSLNVPISRLLPETMYSLGRASEISRDEANFALFIGRLRVRFSLLFMALLEKELVLTNVIKPEDWKSLKHLIKFKFARENDFAELREMELSMDRMNLLAAMTPYIGMYYSHEYVRRHILQQNEEDIQTQDKQIEKEMMMMQYRQPLPGEDPLAEPGNIDKAPNAPSAPPMSPNK